MRVVFLTQDDPLYILPFFESLFALNIEPIKVTGIFACRSMGNRKRMKLLRELVSLYGAAGFAKLLALQTRERLMAMSRSSVILRKSHSLKEVAAGHRVPYQRIDNPNHPENVERIAAHRPDVLASVACPFILKAALLNLPVRAALNIHHAPLPRYKGMMPTFWQMFHGEKSAGVTVHTMSEKLDEGEILHQDSIPILPGETMHQLIRRSKRHGAHAMLQVLKEFADGSPPVPVDVAEEGSYFTFPTIEQIEAFRRRGLRAI
jgi:methionyl-tRNA formyltransferase